MQDEMSLLQGVRALDEESLSETHRRYYTSIYRYISFRVESAETAEDLTSEVFVRLLHAVRDKHAPQRTLRGWLYGVAGFVIKEHYRQKSRIQWTELNESLPLDGDSVESHLDRMMMQAQLSEVMQHLTEEQQQVVALRYGSELSIRETADFMNKTEAAVKMLQARAVAALSRYLHPSGVIA